MKYTKEVKGKYSYSRPKKDISGKQYYQLSVIEWLGFKEVGSLKKRRSVYRCKCTCGNICEVMQTCLTSGNVKSCGCRIKNVKNILYKGENYSILTTLFNNYRQSAKRRNLKFDITRGIFHELIISNCYYCGDVPKLEKNSYNLFNDRLFYNGIDRVDNNKGYLLDNIVPCCKNCNFLKKDIDQKEFLELIKKIYLCKIQ
jgi:hypothetical protein